MCSANVHVCFGAIADLPAATEHNTVEELTSAVCRILGVQSFVIRMEADPEQL